MFYCRNEGGERNYLLLEARRWFTLFFMPVLPLKVLGELVQCSSCGVQYDPGVLASSHGDVTRDKLETFIRIGTELGLTPVALKTILNGRVPREDLDEMIDRP